MKALLRLAAVRDTKQAGELRGNTVHFIASSSALVLMTQNGNIYRALTQTATVFYDDTAANISQKTVNVSDNSLTALLTKRYQVRFLEIVNTCTERREEKRIQRTA